MVSEARRGFLLRAVDRAALQSQRSTDPSIHSTRLFWAAEAADRQSTGVLVSRQ